jgi:DNA-binding CsgD family transcriptional regulator/tetratricopeptide (TPR) repeat protein
VVVGREVELDELLRSVTSARAGRAQCLLLVGEGGVGKTRLLAETAAAGRNLGLGVLAGRSPVATPVAFSVVAEALRSWLRGHAVELAERSFDPGLRLVVPEWTSAGGAEPELSAAQLRLLALEGTVQFVREVARANDGAVVLLDDLHAADPESLEAARYLATAAIEGVTVVGALRPGESQLADEVMRALRRDGVADVIDVAPLEARAVGGLVAALLDADPPEPLVADIVARTDGVPLLVEEVLDAHLRAGTVELGAVGPVWRGGTVGVPRTTRDMVEARMERMAKVHQGVLLAGAVLGDFSPRLLAAVAVTEADVVTAALADGVQAGLLETSGGAIGFRHAVIREAVLEAAVPHAVAVLHQRAADALGAERAADARHLERRAGHLDAVGAVDEVVGLLTAAAKAQLEDHALLGAEQLARDALDRPSASPRSRAAAADTLARALTAQGRWSEAFALDESTVAEHGETPERWSRMATSALEAGRAEDARPIIARAVAAGDDSAAMTLVDGRAALVVGEADHALDCARRVLAAAGDDIDARLGALELLGRASDYLGDRAGAEAAWEQQADEAKAGGRTQAQLRAVVLLGKTEVYAGRRPARLYEAVALAKEAGALVELSWAEENLSVALGTQGDVAAAAAVLAEAVPRCRALRLDQLAYLLMGQAASESFLRASVDDILDEAEAVMPTPDLRLHTFGIRGDIALRYGRWDEALQWLKEADALRRAMPGNVPMDSSCWLVWLLVAMGRREEAVALLDEVRAMPDLARWYGRPVLVAGADALLAGDEAGIDAAIASATGHMPMDIAQMKVLGALILQGPSRLRWLREAFDAYERAGAPIAADHVRKLIREAGGPVPRRKRAPAATLPEALASQGVTRREADVLQLLGEGMANAEIAERLFLSVRTVETHVSSLLAKLGARNRGQLTAMSAAIAFDAP